MKNLRITNHNDDYSNTIKLRALKRKYFLKTVCLIHKKFLRKDRLRKCSFAEANEDLYEIMGNCDVVYQYASTASIEAMSFGKPVLWERDADGNPFKDIPYSGGGIAVTHKDIVDIVKEINFEGNERKRLFDKQEEWLKVAVVDRGVSAKKIVDYIISMAERG